MSLRLDATKLEIRDPSGGLVVNKSTRMIPVVQKVSLTNVDVAFSDVSKGVYSIMNTGQSGTSSADPDNRSWRSYAWGMTIAAGTQSGVINLAAIGAGIAPNLILANVYAQRIVNPNESRFGPLIKAIDEGLWTAVRSGMRLEYNAWLRRIIWFDIAGGYLRLNWKQSTNTYNPNYLDPVWASFWPERWLNLKSPPAYQIGSSYRRSASGDIFPPSTLPLPSVDSGPGGVVSFASTWRFQINAWLMQV